MPNTMSRIYVSLAGFDSFSWDNTVGGPVKIEYESGGEELLDRVADDFQPTAVHIINGATHASLTLRDNDFITIAPGTKSDLTFTLTGKSTVNKTIPDMVFVKVTSSADKATLGNSVLNFVHESADGQTNPIG